MKKKIIGRYQIKAQLGQGGMCTVYRAYDPRLERDVALKMLPAYFAADPQFLTRFQREVKTVARLNHYAIVEIFDFGEDDVWAFFVMRLMEGGALKDRIAEGPLSLEDAYEVLRRMAAALDKAHQRGIVHRDVKPANILYDDDGHSYLADFGLVRLAESSQQFTRTGSTLGTPAYMSPEQVDARPNIDGRSDVYSLGVVLYEMLAGEPPFENESVTRLLMMHLTEPVPDLRQARPELPAALQSVIEKAMAKKPEDRYDTAGELAAAVQAIIDQPPRSAPVPAPTAVSVPEPVRPTAVIVEPPTQRAPTGLATPPEGGATSYIVAGAPPLNIEWCWVPAGPFTMGSNESDWEKPVHTVDLAGYWLARYPVTNADYRHFVQAGGYEQQRWWTGAGWQWRQSTLVKQPGFWTDSTWNGGRQPVVAVSWHEAVAFARWAAEATGEPIGLPTEAQWEKAARGADGRTYPWGNNKPTKKLCNLDQNVGKTTPVGQYSPAGDGPYGNADLAGNVWEWTSSGSYGASWGGYPYDASDGRENTAAEGNRMVRGGSWSSDRNYARAACRNNFRPDARLNIVGFRVVRRSPSK